MAKNAPGKHFRRGMTLLEIASKFPDDEIAEAWFAERRWEGRPACPKCGDENVQIGTAHPTMPYRCRGCRGFFSAKTGTVMEDSKLGYRTWAIAIYLMTTSLKGRSSLQLHRDLGISQKSAWHLAHRIREVWADKQVAFSGPAEADETFVGGKRKNMSAARRRTMTGRGTAGKAIVAGVKDRETNEVSATVVSSTSSRELQGFVRARVEPGAQLFTDDAGGYHRIADYYHESVRHSVREYVRGEVHTNGIESFWAMLKRGHYGTYHYWSRKHLDRYVQEFAGRHNARCADTADQMTGIAREMEGRKLTFERLTA